MRSLAGIGIALVVANAASAQWTVPPAEPEAGVAVFRAACLDGLPGFDGSEAAFERLGMARFGDNGFFETADGAVLGVVSAGFTGCTVRLPASDPRRVAAALNSTMADVLEGVELEAGMAGVTEPGWTWTIGNRRVAVLLVDDPALGPILTARSEEVDG